jgi:hypothetical protein
MLEYNIRAKTKMEKKEIWKETKNDLNASKQIYEPLSAIKFLNETD